MAIKYRNVRTGKIVSVPEPKEVEKAAGSPYAGHKAAVHQRRTIQAMDDSRKWERVASQPVAPPPQPRGDGVHAAGGGWYEVVVGGDVVDKVRGLDAANDAYVEQTTDTEAN